MENIENTVAAQNQEAGAAVEQSVDDAQATEISVEEVLASLNAGDEGGEETVENEGDDGQSAQEEQQELLHAFDEAAEALLRRGMSRQELADRLMKEE